MPHPLAHYLDFANHHANATPADIEKVCANVAQHGFHAAFVNACYITLAKKTGVRDRDQLPAWSGHAERENCRRK